MPISSKTELLDMARSLVAASVNRHVSWRHAGGHVVAPLTATVANVANRSSVDDTADPYRAWSFLVRDRRDHQV
jgi:hypothetical protein